MSIRTKRTDAEFSKYFLSKKTLHGPKTEPVWVFLEREMLQNIDKKPYNKKVGDWLKFLKKLKRYLYLQRKKQEKVLTKECGPMWYVEMSGIQKEVLRNLGNYIHYDLIEYLPKRTRKCLSDLGITRRIPKRILLKAMNEACDDAVVFIWKLYTAIYKKSPSEQCQEYDMDAMLLMSAMTHIDLEECVENLAALTKPVEETPKPVKKKKKVVKKSVKYNCPYGEYLEKFHVPVYCRHPSPQRVQRVKPPPPRMEKKITLRSNDSYERLRMDDTFLKRRCLRSLKARQVRRESPARSSNKGMGKYNKKSKLQSAKPTHIREGDIANMKFHVGPVVSVRGRPRYLLNNIVVLPTGYIAIHGGNAVSPSGEYLTVIAGAWKYPIEKDEKCDPECDCVKWEHAVMKFLEESKCKCFHYYDYKLEGKSKEKYFYPPTKDWPMWFDEAKIFQLDPMEDFIKETVRLAEMSEEQTATPAASHAELSNSCITGGMKGLLKSLLADLSDTALVIPHLPQAYLLNNLLEWMRKRFKGDLPPTVHRSSLLKSMRRWSWLYRIRFIERAYMIPFTREELEEMTWADRHNLQTLFETLLRDFTLRNQLRQLQQSRLWWPTMQFDRYPSDAFLDVYFTYMPSRTKDTNIYNPFNSLLTPKDIYKTCPLS